MSPSVTAISCALATLVPGRSGSVSSPPPGGSPWEGSARLMNEPPTGHPLPPRQRTADPVAARLRAARFASSYSGAPTSARFASTRRQLPRRRPHPQVAEHARADERSPSVLGHDSGVCDGWAALQAGEGREPARGRPIFERCRARACRARATSLPSASFQASKAAGLRIFTEAKVDRARRGMGTTATIAGLIDDHLFLAHGRRQPRVRAARRQARPGDARSNRSSTSSSKQAS